MSTALEDLVITFTDESHEEPCGTFVTDCPQAAIWRVTFCPIFSQRPCVCGERVVFLCDAHAERVRAIDREYFGVFQCGHCKRQTYLQRIRPLRKP